MLPDTLISSTLQQPYHGHQGHALLGSPTGEQVAWYKAPIKRITPTSVIQTKQKKKTFTDISAIFTGLSKCTRDTFFKATA